MTALIDRLVERRLADPVAYAARVAERPRPTWTPGVPLLVVAADHPARGVLQVGADPQAMADRDDLLRRCVVALGRPGVNGFLGTADLIADLANLGALDGMLVFGSMNRGGIAGSAFETDDRLTGYDVAGIVADDLVGGKMLLRYDLGDPATAATMQACAQAITALGRERRIALVEPFIASRDADGHLLNDLSVEAVVKSVALTAGLGATSAWTWLKLPAVDDMARVATATSLPILLLGGDVPDEPERARRLWAQALAPSNVRGMAIGRAALYPADGDVAAAIDAGVEILGGTCV